MGTIAVLLTCHNRKEKTLQCLQSLYSCSIPSGFNYDIYLVDDGCTDSTGNAVQQQFPKVNIITGNGNLFWNRGMLLAWKTAYKTKNYDFYLWLNDDTLMEPNALRVLLQTSEQFCHKSIMVGTTSSIEDTSRLTYGGHIKKGTIIHPSDQPILCRYFNGNVVLIPRYVYQKVGTNDPFYHHFLGDIDYGLRAKKEGIQSFVVPGIIGKCEEHETLQTWCDPKKKFIERWKTFRSPLGQNPEEFFVFEYRHNGIIKACFHYFTNHLRVCCPWIWV